MGENSGVNTAEKSISGVENRPEGGVQNAVQKQRYKTWWTGIRTWEAGREGPVIFLGEFPDM